MAEPKVQNLQLSIALSGVRENEKDETVGYNESLNIVLDFGNETQIEKELAASPWLMEVVGPIVKQLNKAYEARVAVEKKPKEKTNALKEKLKGLI